MFEILMIFFIYLISLNIAAFLGVGILSLFFQFKKRSIGGNGKNGRSILTKLVQKVWLLAYTSATWLHYAC